MSCAKISSQGAFLDNEGEPSVHLLVGEAHRDVPRVALGFNVGDQRVSARLPTAQLLERPLEASHPDLRVSPRKFFAAPHLRMDVMRALLPSRRRRNV